MTIQNFKLLQRARKWYPFKCSSNDTLSCKDVTFADGGENERFGAKIRRSDTFSTTNPTWSVSGLSPGHGGEKPVTNYLSHNVASMK